MTTDPAAMLNAAAEAARAGLVVVSEDLMLALAELLDREAVVAGHNAKAWRNILGVWMPQRAEALAVARAILGTESEIA